MAIDEARITAVRCAAGPGGQHVNKVATTARLRWNIWRSGVFDEVEKKRIETWMAKHKPSQHTHDGDILITSNIDRSLSANKAHAKLLLQTYITLALIKPKRRIPTVPSKGERQKRFEQKQKQSRKKQQRKTYSEI